MKKLLSIIMYFFVVLIVTSSCYYFIKIYKINNHYNQLYDIKSDVCLRKFPYPYKAALAIANDIDSTDTVGEFLSIHDYLNTKNITNMGAGVDLEIGDSFFMFDPKDNFSFFSTKDKGKDKIIISKFIETGYLDSLHSFGDGYKNRNDAQVALNELKKNNNKLSVWINHSQEKSNFGGWYSTNLGDNRDSKYYHADLTIPYGIKFVWLGKTTNIIGQATHISFYTFIGSFDPEYPAKSFRNIVKTILKNILSIYQLWPSRYSSYEENDLVNIVKLEDGQKVYEFTRFDNHPDGIGAGANSKNMAYNLSGRVLRQLKQVNGYGILYTHFGKNEDCPQEICEETQSALRNLRNEYLNGDIYVTTTSKLLSYYIAHKYLKVSSRIDNNDLIIVIHSIEDPVFGTYVPSFEDLQGITFYIPSGKRVKIYINQKEIRDFIRNQADENNRESVTIPIKINKYPNLK